MITLSPFEVAADANDGYEATGMNSLTGMSRSLNETPADARVMTRTLIAELGGGDVFKLLGEHGGLGATLFGSGNEDQRGMQEGDGVQPEGLTGRGFAIGTPRRDGFLRSATSLMSSFDVESADVINGSNNLLYGSGDASGVVVVNSKRAQVARTYGTITAKFDSEGSEVQMMDFNYGSRRFALRLNLMNSEDRYYRPFLGLDQKGLQASLTIRPFRWMSIFADYRNYERGAATSTGATVRVPTSSNLVLNNGVPLDNQSTAYITGYGGTELLNGLITYTNQDSLWGSGNRQHWINESNSITIDLTPTKDLAFQFRQAHDTRENFTMQPTSTTFYSPDHPSNGLKDQNGVRIMEWAVNGSLQSYPYITGADGYKATAVGHRDLGVFGDHRLAAFYTSQKNWTVSRFGRWYETDSQGNFVQNMANIKNSDSGRNPMPAIWRPIFESDLPFGVTSWPQTEIAHPNGKIYRFDTSTYPGAVPATPTNPWGVSGPTDAEGHPTSGGYQWDETKEEGWGLSLGSKFWNNRIDTLLSYRREEATSERLTTAVVKGPIEYDSKAFGAVVDTPVKGLRLYANYALNSKINFATDRDIYNNLLPIGEGESTDVGLKLSMWDNRLSGSVTYYVTNQLNNTASLGGFRDDIDPDGINGRNGGPGYIFSRTSDGMSVALSMRPIKAWTLTMSWTQSNGSERSDVVLPIFYNDEFNTTTVGGQSVVAIKDAGTGALTPLLVLSDPADPASAMMPLSIAMLKDPESPYFAQLDPDCGRILNSQDLGMRTPGVGTDRTALPISSHQLGFVPPTEEITVRKAGEVTTGYAENAYSLINRYQFNTGKLKGLVLGLSTIYQQNFRAYRYTDAADGNARKTFYYPDRFQNNVFIIYNFKPIADTKTRFSVQLNIDNVFDEQEIIAHPRSTNGTIRYFREQYTPRKVTFTTSMYF